VCVQTYKDADGRLLNVYDQVHLIAAAIDLFAGNSKIGGARDACSPVGSIA
jgi:hypothetical protein